MIKTSLVPIDLYEKTENRLDYWRCEYQKEMGVWQIKYDSLKLAIGNVKDERDSLESEKKLFQEKIKEVSLQLERKTEQYDELLNSDKAEYNQKVNANAATPKTKEETQETESASVTVPSSPHAQHTNGPVQHPVETAPNPETPTQTGQKRSNTEIYNLYLKYKKSLPP